MANPLINTLSLCSGYGGLDLGLDTACGYLGIESRTVAYVEWEAYAAALLVARMEAGHMAAAPVWCGDLGKLNGADFRGAVDCVTAGFPCQPHSQAGARKGINDERWIWPAIARIIRESGAWLVVLENVPGLLSSGGFGPILADLAEAGFDAEWGVLSAAAVGASHRRERVFIVGYSASARWAQTWSGRQEHAGRKSEPGLGDMGDAGLQHQQLQQRPDGAEHSAAGEGVDHAAGSRCNSAWLRSGADIEGGKCVPCERRDSVADSLCVGRQQNATGTHGNEGANEWRSSQYDYEFAGIGAGMADASSANREGRRHRDNTRGRQEPHGHAGLEGGELFAPGPNSNEWGEIITEYPHLAPAIESGLRVLADGAQVVVDQHRAHQLRLGGNGVVPLQAAAAIALLARRLGITG